MSARSRRRRRARLALLLSGALLLAACGPVPRPFQPEDKADNVLLDMRDRAGIVVMPMSGGSPATAAALSEAMAATLRNRDIPAATTGGNRESRHLYGRAAVRPLPGGREEILLYWELRDPDGRRIGTHTQRRELTADAWQAGEAKVMADLAAEIAPAIAAMVQDPAVEPAPIPGFPRARLVILGMGATPGDGGASLPRALAAELHAAKLPVAEQIDASDILVHGNVVLGPAEGGLQMVSITWSLVTASGERKLGEIAQQSVVPAGSLDGPWGPVADEIARAAASGLRELLGQAGKL